MRIINKNFYERSTVKVAEELLGKILIHEISNELVACKIVETEAYLGAFDKAAHAYKYRKTNRVMPMYEPGGTIYVYSIYGKYVCLNAITETKGNPQGVLIRAVEPIIGLDTIALNRFGRKYNELNKREILNLTSGPSKLCIAMDISKNLNNKNFFGGELYISEIDNDLRKKFEIKEEPEGEIIRSKRIGVDYAEEAKDYLFRYYYKENPYVSVKDKNI